MLHKVLLTSSSNQTGAPNSQLHRLIGGRPPVRASEEQVFCAKCVKFFAHNVRADCHSLNIDCKMIFTSSNLGLIFLVTYA